MTKKKPETPKQPWQVWHPYPKPDGFRSGMKVSWNYYRNRADAEICAAAAQHNARIQLSQGFDFGYQSPGSITVITERNGMPDKLGMFEVCLP